LFVPLVLSPPANQLGVNVHGLYLAPAGASGNGALRALCLQRFNVSLGGGLGPLNGRVFRIGHLGDLNEPMVLGTLATVELAMQVLGVPHAEGGVGAAIKALG
jgi:alanine-glyoxylate transaminase/serine-glyoxylate transaminase/serine-pyruvate transaminase